MEYLVELDDPEPMAALTAALLSDNETVRSALDALVIAVRMAEPEKLVEGRAMLVKGARTLRGLRQKLVDVNEQVRLLTNAAARTKAEKVWADMLDPKNPLTRGRFKLAAAPSAPPPPVPEPVAESKGFWSRLRSRN